MFALNQKVVYPSHGVATVSSVIQKKIAGNNVQCFELTFLNKDLKISVAVASFDTVGIRPLSSSKHVDALFDLLQEDYGYVQYDASVSNWNKRHKDYQCKLRTGDLHEIGKMYCELLTIAQSKGLSFGEKGILKQIECFLAEEISAVKNMLYEEAIKHMRELYQSTRAQKTNLVQKSNSRVATQTI